MLPHDFFETAEQKQARWAKMISEKPSLHTVFSEGNFGVFINPHSKKIIVSCEAPNSAFFFEADSFSMIKQIITAYKTNLTTLKNNMEAIENGLKKYPKYSKWTLK